MYTNSPRDVFPSLSSLDEYLRVSRSRYDACIDVIHQNLTIDNVQATLRFHYVRFDSNGKPKIADLARCLADHIIWYCFSARRIGTPSSADEWSRLNREARHLLRKVVTSGEAGEMLLYFLLESVICAPQMVAKLDLKTNRQMEVHGSDGIHMKWCGADGCLDIYFGEAKLHADVSGALSGALTSIENFHEEDLMNREFGLVTSHYKWADDRLKDAVLSFVDRQAPGPDCRINHACLIGHDWQKYRGLVEQGGPTLVDLFRDEYSLYAQDLHALTSRRFSNFKYRYLRFEIFFLPFLSVDAFRRAFMDAVA